MMIGAMAPDFPYFILLSHTIIYGHSLQGVFTFCLPAGLSLLWLYHRVFKLPLLAVAPDHLARRVSEQDIQFSFWPASRFAWLAVSVVIGSFTHIFWDDFTHERGLFVTMAPELRLYFGLHMPLFAVLQLGSTVVGAGFLAWAYWRWLRRADPNQNPIVSQLSVGARTVLFTACVAGILVCAIPYGLHFANKVPRYWWSVFIVKAVIASITAGFVELFVYSMAWHLNRGRKALAAEREG
jgi:hypothetical protein